MTLRVAIVGYPLLSYRQWRLYSEVESDSVEVHLIVPNSWPSIPTDEHPGQDEQFSVYRHRTVFSGRLMRYLMPGIVRSVSRVDPDVVLTHAEPWAAITLFVEAVCEWIGAPHLVFSWENLERVPQSRIQRKAEQRTVDWIDGVIAGSDAVSARLRSRGFTGPITVAPQTGVDVQQFRPVEVSVERYEALGIEPDSPVVLYAGRLAREKGIEDLLATVPKVLAEHPEVQYLIVGDGEMTHQVEQQVASQGLDRVSLVTEKQPYELMPAIHSTATVFAYPSRTIETWAEQFGYSVAEAMACEVPVVTTDCGSLPYVVGEGGVVCPERNPEALGTAIADLISNPDRREKLATAGRKRVLSEFSISEVADTHYRALRQAASDSTKSA